MLGLIGGALGAAGSIYGIAKGANMAKHGRRVLGNRRWSDYQESQYAKEGLGAARQNYNAQPAWAVNQARGIQSNYANMMGQVGRNATDGSQALAMAAAGQGMADQATSQLGDQVSQDQNSRFAFLQQALGAMTAEKQFKHQAMAQKYQMDTQEGLGYLGAGQNSVSNGIGGLSNMMFGMQGLMNAGGAGALGIGGKKPATGGGGSYAPSSLPWNV